MSVHADYPTSTFILLKDSPGCTGMFFRKAPRGVQGPGGALSSNWPRDGASLAGDVVEDADGASWLRCRYVRQAKSTTWETVSNGFMPFRYSQYYLERKK